MSEAREIGRMYMNAASDVVATIADHSCKTAQVAGNNTMQSFAYLSRLAGAKLEWKRSRFRMPIVEIR